MKLASLYFSVIFSFSVSQRSYSDIVDAPNMATGATKVWQNPELADLTAFRFSYGRSIWDMQNFDGRIFMGYGDLAGDLGPIKIFELTVDHIGNVSVVTNTTINSEEIKRLRIQNGDLIFANNDPRKGPGISGDYVVRAPDDSWTAIEISSGKHFYDMVYWNNEWFATDTISGVIKRSSDRSTWSNTPVATGALSFLALHPHPDGVLATTGETYPVYLFDGTGWTEAAPSVGPRPSTTPRLTEGFSYSFGEIFIRSTTFQGAIYYTLLGPYAPLYRFVTTAPDTYQVEMVPPFDLDMDQPYLVTDILERDARLYVLAQHREGDQRYADVFVTDDAQHWYRLASVPVPVFPRSFEILNDRLFIGLSTDARPYTTADAGSVYMVDRPVSELLSSAGNVVFDEASIVVQESDTSAQVTLKRVLGSSGSASVRVTSSGTATAGSEYTAIDQVVSWADGDTSDKIITVALSASDGVNEPDETVLLTLSSPSGVLLFDTVATLIINDEDGEPPVVNAGSDHTIQLPDSSIRQLNLTGSVSNGSSYTATWTATGPDHVFFEDANAIHTSAEFHSPGVYQLTLSVEDGLNEVSRDHMQVTVLPRITGAKVYATEANTNQYTGFSVAASDTRCAMISLKSTDGTFTDGGGAAYVFERQANSWQRTATLVPNDGLGSNRSLYDISMSGDTITVSGSQVFVFEHNGAQWQQTATLSDLDGNAPSASVINESEDLIAVSTSRADSNRGAVYIFAKQNNSWVRTDKIVPSDVQSGDRFGLTLDLSGYILAASSQFRDDGVVYVYERQLDGSWDEQARLEQSGHKPDPRFGLALALDGSTLFTGAPYLNELTGRQEILVYEQTGASWVYQETLTNPGASTNDGFGISLDLHGDLAAISALQIHPITSLDAKSLAESIVVYLYQRDHQGDWQLIDAVDRPSTPYSSHQYGRSVSLSTQTLMVSDYDDEDHGDSSGCAYIFDLPAQLDVPLDALASATPRTATTNSVISFQGDAVTDLSLSNAALTYAWDFDNDGNTDSTAQHPTHTYTTEGTYTAKLTVSDGTETATDTVTLTVNSPYSVGYTNWVSAFNWSGETATAPDDNPDGDHLNNFLEYALGSNPVEETNGNIPTFLRNGTAFDVTFRRERSGVTYTLQSSTDLVTWTDESINPGAIGEDVTDSISMGSEDLLFIRLKVEE